MKCVGERLYLVATFVQLCFVRNHRCHCSAWQTTIMITTNAHCTLKTTVIAPSFGYFCAFIFGVLLLHWWQTDLIFG